MLYVSGLRELSKETARIEAEHGFEPASRENALAKLMLVVTEVAEAAEDVRNQRWEHFGEEIADTFIRLLNLCYSMGIDIDAEIARKMLINEARPYRHGGKTA